MRNTGRQEMAKQGDLESCKLFLSVISTLSDVMEDLELENIYHFLFYVNTGETELDENSVFAAGVLRLVLEQFPIMRGNGIGPYYAALTPIITFEHLLLYYLVLLLLILNSSSMYKL